jgi:hypothetical protein
MKSDVRKISVAFVVGKLLIDGEEAMPISLLELSERQIVI